MATPAASTLHPVPIRALRQGLARRSARLASELLLGTTIATGITVAGALLLLLALLTAPFAAVLLGWMLWRSGGGAAREARRVRARLRRRARTLGLVVLAGSRPALLRLAAAGTRPHPAPPAVR